MLSMADWCISGRSLGGLQSVVQSSAGHDGDDLQLPLEEGFNVEHNTVQGSIYFVFSPRTQYSWSWGTYQIMK
jgi:hypothetical protein